MIPLGSVSSPTLGHDSPLTLLVIEDSTSDSELVLALLEDELPHAVVAVAANLHDALERLERSPYDLVLADLSLPDADGLAVVHAVRAAHPQTALLVLTGRGDGRLALWALADGAQDYLVKGEHDGPRLATALLHALQRHRSEQKAQQYLQLARGLLDALEAPTCAVDENGVIIAANLAWADFTVAPGVARGEWGVGASYLDNYDALAASDHEAAASAAASAEGLRGVLSGRLRRHEHEYARPGDDDDRWFSARVAPAEIGTGRGAVISHVDVTDMHSVQMALTHQALHDSLTGLPNRMLLADRLEQACAESRRSGRHVGVAFLDLDHFKRINDSLGHSTGDALLVQVAERLKRVMREGDTLSRYAGDEFVVVWRDVERAQNMSALSARLLEALTEPFDLGHTSVNLSASVGVALTDMNSSADELLMAADAAMYDAKRRGGARLRLFSDELRQNVMHLMTTEVDLRAAISRSDLVLHYQPVMDLASGRPVAVEALARWQHPERGLLAPSQFIPVAESSGLIVPLGRWALEQACRDAAAFSGEAYGLDVAVNLSVLQLIQPDVVDHVRQALEQSGLDPVRLLLEVTESVFMQDADAAATALNGLVELGVRIAIDDFGTGYSSLLYLRRYPISALKLDKAFVSGIGVSLNDEAICRSVVSLSHAVGATSIGEGVETEEQMTALRALGCRQAQGFLWSAAVPVEDLHRVLTQCTGADSSRPLKAARRLRAVATAPPFETLDRAKSLRAQGASSHSIAAALNMAGATSSDGRRWTAVTVNRQLLSRVDEGTQP